MLNRIKSLVLVALQFIFIFLLLSDTTFKNLSVVVYGFIFCSILLIFWAIITMQKSKLRIFPAPSVNATLIVTGPYRFIRHPMYTAILLGSTGLLVHQFSLVRLAFVITLAIVLLIKLTWEEKLLSQKFIGYSEYSKQTAKLFPFIF